jgi:hypothetical protein
MEEINGDKIKIILNDLDEEFHRFNHYHRAKFITGPHWEQYWVSLSTPQTSHSIT